MISLWLSVIFACTDPKDRDVDGDGFIAAEDCDDENPEVHPLAKEVCNDIDDNCDGVINNNPEDGLIYLADFDGDGVGDDNAQFNLCAQEDGYVTIGSGGDCNDDDASIFPGNIELCNEIDDNCNDEIDEEPENGVLFYVDVDGDGYGDANDVVNMCSMPEGYVENNTDCDDQSNITYPGSAELDSQTDCMIDVDGDGFGEMSVEGTVVAGTDCNDVDDAVYPAASERCNGIDDDCDDLIDDADNSVVDMVTVYLDSDGDGYGRPESVMEKCYPLENEIEQSGDCDDADASVNPTAVEICDGIDNDCDSNTPEDGMVHMWDAQGFGTDVTNSFTGTFFEPALYETTQDMDLYFCTGEYSVTIDTTGDLGIYSIGNVMFRAADTSLSGDSTSLVVNRGGATTTVVEGVAIDGYYGAILVGSEDEIDSTLTIDDVTIINSPLAVYMAYGEANISNSFFEECDSFYGVITTVEVDLYLDTVDISSTVGSNIGVFMSLGSLDMNHSTISDASGSGVYLSEATGVCADSSSTLSSGVSSSNIGVYLISSTWESTACNYELEGSPDENGVDVQIASGAGYYVDNNASFSCTTTECGTQYTQDVSASTESNMFGREYVDVYTADVDLTINSFTTNMSGAGCGNFFFGPCVCDVEFAMHTKQLGAWVETWSNTRSSFYNGNVSSGAIGEPIRTGEEFALSVDFSCAFSMTYKYDSISSIPIPAWITYQESYIGEAGGGVNNAYWSLNQYSYYDQVISVTRVP